MRVYELVHELINKFVPMDELTKVSLKNDAAAFYSKSVAEKEQLERQNKEALDFNEKFKNEKDFKPERINPLKMQHKVIDVFESWYMRYIFAILFVILVPKIKDYINGDNQPIEEEDNDSDELSQYLEFKRFKQSSK